jgi:Flp pilus assembly protein TadD
VADDSQGPARPARRGARRDGVSSGVLEALVLLLFLPGAGCRFVYTRTVELSPRPRREGLRAESVSEVLLLPEEEIDLGRAALLVAREDRPDIEVGRHLRRLDEIAERLKRRLPEGTSVADAVRETVRLVQPVAAGARGGGPPAVQHDAARPAEAAGEGDLPPEIDLARILDGECAGNCLGSSLLYLAVAERAGLPLRGVSAPEHFFVRFDDGITRVNIEPTRGGRSVPDDGYRREKCVSDEAFDAGIYLRSESKRQVLANLLANRAGYRALGGRLERALRDAEAALAVKPYWPQAHVNRGLALELSGRLDEAGAEYRRALELDPHCAGALNNLAALRVRESEEMRAESSGEASPADAAAVIAAAAARGAKLESAERMIRLAVRLAPSRPEFRETAAAVAAARGDLGAARRRLGCALRLDPANERYAEALRKIETRLAGAGGAGSEEH